MAEANDARDEAVTQARRVAELEAELHSRACDLEAATKAAAACTSEKGKELEQERAARSVAEVALQREKTEGQLLADQVRGELEVLFGWKHSQLVSSN